MTSAPTPVATTSSTTSTPYVCSRELEELDTYWTHALFEGGPFPIGEGREAEVKAI
jgi:hypothetical protein